MLATQATYALQQTSNSQKLDIYNFMVLVEQYIFGRMAARGVVTVEISGV